jgi:pimeloyl-ACP methyl ester carboxylesterase
MLFDLGHNVFIPRAPYHGLRSLRVSELAQLTPSDLRTYANEAVDIGCGLGDELILIGISGGATIAAWTAQNRREIDCTLLGVPFFGFYGLPDRLSFQLMKLLGRLPDFALKRPGELRRPWAYRGQSTHGVVAYLSLAGDVLDGSRQGIVPAGKMIIITTSGDKLANNDTTARLAKLWLRSGVEVVQFDFARELQVAHNSVDPAADPLKRQLVNQKMLALLGERP